jgi:hypothetical protein
MPFNVEKTIAQVREIEQFIAAEELAFKEKMRPYNELAEDFRNQLLQFLLNTNQRNARTNAGTAYIADKESIKVLDKQEFQRHVIGTEAWHMIIWAVNKTAAKEFEKAEGVMPPGVDKTVIKEVRVLAPDRKPTKTKLAVVPSEGAPLSELEDEDPEGTESAVGFD